MKKILALLLALWIPAAVLSGCVPQDDSAASNKLNIVTTIFPAYDWVREILGDETDRAEITMLLDSGVDLHSYQPTVDDIVKISDCDLFLYVGGESDGWVDDALKNAPNKERKVIRLLDVLGDSAKAEETVAGMQEEEHDHEEEAEYDEHIWLSLKNAQVLVAAISEALQESDPARKGTYAANAAAYAEKLSALDGEYRAAVDSGKYKTLLFGDRFPFRYLADDYGLDYYAAFPGCSAETEASFETVSFLAGKMDALGLPCVLTIEGTQHKIAETVVQNTAQKNQLPLHYGEKPFRAEKSPGTGGGMMALLSCQNLSVGYEGKPVLQNLSFEIFAGDYLCIVGENGSGKTTLMKTLLGLQPPIGGSILTGDGLQRNEIGYLPQQTQVQRDFPASVREIDLSAACGPFITGRKNALRRRTSAKCSWIRLQGGAIGSSPAVSSSGCCWPGLCAQPGKCCFWMSRFPALTLRSRRNYTVSSNSSTGRTASPFS